jgi:hypothetical protein
MLAGAFFSGIALFTRRPHWSLDAEDQKELGEAVSGVMPTISPAAAKAIASASPWVRLALVAGTLVSTRVAADAFVGRPVPQQAPPHRAAQPPPQQQQRRADVVFPMPPFRDQEQPSAAQAAAELHPIFRGEVPNQSPIVDLTKTTPGTIMSTNGAAPLPQVPGLDD